MFSLEALNSVTNVTQDVVDDKCRELDDGQIHSEDGFTDALLSSLRDRINGLLLRSEYNNSYGSSSAQAEYRVSARTMSCRYHRSEENLSGADILVGIKGVVDNVEINKAALVQAKLFDGDYPYEDFPTATTERRKLQAQCMRMIQIAGDHAYVIVYSSKGILFFTAKHYLRVFEVGLSYRDGLNFSEFVQKLFSCEVGNHNLSFMVREDFRNYLDRLQIRSGFLTELDEE